MANTRLWPNCHFFLTSALRCLVVVTIPASLLSILLPFVVFEGRPLVGACIHEEYLNHREVTIVRLFSAAIVEGPAAVYLYYIALTPYLQQVSFYVWTSWLTVWLEALNTALYCSRGRSETMLYIFELLARWASSVLFGWLILSRIRALESTMLMNFHSQCLCRSFVALVTALVVGHFMGIGVVFGVSVLGGIVLFMLVLGPFAYSANLMRSATRRTTGRLHDEAKHASRTADKALIGVAVSVLSTVAFIVSFATFLNFKHPPKYVVVFIARIDSWANVVVAFAFSGALTHAVGRARRHRSEEVLRVQVSKRARADWQPCEHGGWSEKVSELAHRGFTLSALLNFYQDDLPHMMPDFDPTQHRTSDVVRRAIIPLSSRAQTAHAIVMMDGEAILPMKMVTHNWGNLFRDLVAAIVADAFDEDEYEYIANLLDRDVEKVQEWASKRGVAEHTYWVCAFSVSQHVGICENNPFHDQDPVTGEIHPTCSCGATKFFNTTPPLHLGRSVHCEMNKFDDMMGYLSAHDSNFAQVIAVDAEFDVFSRAWCVAEIAKAHNMGMRQCLKLLSGRALEDHSERLRNLRIENMVASRPEDVEEILNGIPDKTLFNRKLQSMVCDKLVAGWNNLDACEQMSVLGRVARWHQLSTQRSFTGVLVHRHSQPSGPTPSTLGNTGFASVVSNVRLASTAGSVGFQRAVIEQGGVAELPLEPRVNTTWRCTWEGGVGIRSQPDLDSKWQGFLGYSQIFQVSEQLEKRSAGLSITFLKLLDGRGWVFDRDIRGKVCELVEAYVWTASGVNFLPSVLAAFLGNPQAGDDVTLEAKNELENQGAWTVYISCKHIVDKSEEIDTVDTDLGSLGESDMPIDVTIVNRSFRFPTPDDIVWL